MKSASLVFSILLGCLSVQSATISITGKVTHDLAGKSGITVIFTDSSSNNSDTAISNTSGEYSISLGTSTSSGRVTGFIIDSLGATVYNSFNYGPAMSLYPYNNFVWYTSWHKVTIRGNVSNRDTNSISVFVDTIGGVLPDSFPVVNKVTGDYSLSFTSIHNSGIAWVYIINCQKDTLKKPITYTRGGLISNINYIYCATIGYSTVSGGVYKEFKHAKSATVLLISKDKGVVDAITTGDGRYSFTVPDSTASYYISAYLDWGDQDYGMYVPTYSNSSLFWKLANPIPPSYNKNFIREIDLFAIIPLQGTAFIDGFVWDMPNVGFGKREPRDNTILMLLQNGKAVASTFSEPDGRFSFQNIPYGTYTVHAEVTGLSTKTLEITVSETEMKIEDVEVLVNPSDVTISRETTGISPSPLVDSFDVYPNPFNSSLHIEFEDYSKSVSFILSDINGKVIRQRDDIKSSVTINTLEFDHGVYFLTVTSGVQTKTIKLIH